jgi:SRSO17 transposase
MVPPKESAIWAPSTCLARNSGLSANIARPASANIISPNLPADTPLKQLAAAIKARWVCEQAHQQLKEELGLDHFEGRSWAGLHRHALMTMIAYAFLQSRRLKQAKGGKKNPRPTAAAKPARDPAGHPLSPRTAAARPMSSLSQILAN